MKTYTVTKTFNVSPQGLTLSVNDTILKFDNLVVVQISDTIITSETFWAWIGSVPSLEFIELTSTSADPSNPVDLTPIDLNSNFKTSDLVNKINALIYKGENV